jgi:hypothetical protein
VELSRCAGTRVGGRAREWCGEVRWRPRAMLAFYRGSGSTGEAVTRAVTAGVNGIRH